MPRPFHSAPARAAVAVVLIAATVAMARGQAPSLEDLTLRPAIPPANPRSQQVRTAQFGSPAGSGAGTSGFVSTNPFASAAQKANVVAQTSAATTAQQAATMTRQATGDDEPTAAILRRRRPRAPEEEPYGPVGFRVGSFEIRPSIEIYGGHDDNPFRTRTDRLPSNFTHVEGRIEARSNWSRHELTGELRGAYTDYLQVPGNDRPEAEGVLRGRIDVTSHSRIEVEGRAALTTDAAGTPDAITSARRPPHIYTAQARAGFVQRFNRFELGLYGNVERAKHQDAELNSGQILDLSDRDYTGYGATLRGSYETLPGTRAFAEAEIDRRVYDHEVDFEGVRRGSDGMRLRAGLEFAREQRLSGEISAGWAHRSYDDATLDDVSGLIFDAALVWRASGLTTVTLRASSEIDETTVAGASGVFYRRASATIDHAFRRWLIGTAGVAYGIDDYRGAGREDRRLEFLAGLTYYFNRYAALKGEFRHERLRSTVTGDGYTANVFMLGLRLQR